MSSPLEPTSALHGACVALWLATLSLMTAYMQNPAPAHRLMTARRIARNLDTLSRQDTVFTPECRNTFARLAVRWGGIATRVSMPSAAPRVSLPSHSPEILSRSGL